MPSGNSPDIVSSSPILRYATRHAFTRSIEDPDTAPAWRDAIRVGNVSTLVIEGRAFHVELLPDRARFIDAARQTPWQWLVRTLFGDSLRAHLEQSVDRTGAPSFMGPVPAWSRRRAAALHEEVARHRIILNAPLSEGQDAALYRPRFHTRGIDRSGAELLFRQDRFDAQGQNFRRGRLAGIDLRERNLERTILNESDLHRADLRRADLRGAALRGARLREAILAGARLHDADLRGANLRKADLRGLDLTGTALTGARLHGARLEGATLALPDLLALIGQRVDVHGTRVQWTPQRGQACDGAHLRRLIGAGVDLRGADLHGLNLRGLDFGAADLEGANLKGACLLQANLQGATLRKADLHQADLARVRLGWRTLAGARLDRTALASLRKPPLTRGIPGMEEQDRRRLRQAVAYARTFPTPAERHAALDEKYPPHLPHDLYGVDLAGQDLHGFDFRYISLADANLAGAILDGAMFHGATLTGTDLRGATINGALVTSADLAGARLASTALGPSGDSVPRVSSPAAEPGAADHFPSGQADSAPASDLGADLPADAMAVVDSAAIQPFPGEAESGPAPWIATPGEPKRAAAAPATVSAVA